MNRATLDAVLGFTLTDQQWEAVSADLTPAVIVAGAGSGKTTSMAARVAWLVGSGLVPPDGVLGLTFTTKSAGQLLSAMRARLEGLVPLGLLAEADHDGSPLGDPQVFTYHAFSARIVAAHGIRLGREPVVTMLDDGARQQLAYRLVCRTDIDLSDAGRSPVDLANDVLSLDDELVELGLSTDRLREFDAELIRMLHGAQKPQRITRDMIAASTLRLRLCELVDEWREEKARRDVMDFADQIRLAGQIVEAFPDVVAELRAQYPVVLLDEYQDTSIAQRMLLQWVFGAGHSVMAVGDPCQAIYGWRGASVDNIESFPVHFRASANANSAPAARFALSENRRSGPTILEVANRASAHLRSVHSGVEPLTPPRDSRKQGQVQCALFDTYNDELAWVVQEILCRRALGGSWSDFAVLAATGRDLVNLDAALRRVGAPTQLYGAAALLAQPAVIDVRAMLELILDPTANPSFVRVASGSRWRIGARDLAALGSRAAYLAGGRHRSGQEDIDAALDDAVAGTDPVDSVSLTEALDDLGDEAHYSAEAVERFRAVARELHELRRHVGEPLTEFILRVLRTTGLEVEASLGDPEIAAQQQQALAAFVELAAEFTDIDGRVTLGAFLGRLRDAERFDLSLDLEVPGPADAVQLLTIHKAKGLEFAHVFVPFVAKGAFPGGRTRSQWPTSGRTVPWPLRDDCTDELADFPPNGEPPRARDHATYKQALRAISALETQRLAYVAFTRAEVGLTVSGHWWGPSQATRRGPDEFLQLVHQACLDGAGDVAYWAAEPAEDAVNPDAAALVPPARWPVEVSASRLAALDEAAAAVSSVQAHQVELPGMTVARTDLSPADAQTLARWDLLAAALLEEEHLRRARERVIALPQTISASLLMRALDDPEGVARDLARPMPHPPAPAARRGTQFHAWVETRFGQQSLLDPDDLPGAADHDITSDADLEALKQAFAASEWSGRDPVGVEVPFALLIGGRVVNGRIDAVFETAGRYEVVDWKTGSARGVDPVQLAIYRLAWAQAHGVEVDVVDAAFVLVATGETLRPQTDAIVAALRAM